MYNMLLIFCQCVRLPNWIFILYIPGYYFNETGLLVCEPFYSKPSYRILATCSLYFPTTMILMYCYGSSFHASRFRFVVSTPSSALQARSLAQTQTTTITAPAAVSRITIPPSNAIHEKVNCVFEYILRRNIDFNLSWDAWI